MPPFFEQKSSLLRILLRRPFFKLEYSEKVW